MTYKPIVALFEIDREEERYLAPKLQRYRTLFFRGPLTARMVGKVRDAEALVVFIYSTVSEAVMGKLPKLKFIATASTGYEHIDLEAACRQRIKVSNVPFYGENTVAEHTFALILSLSRKIHQSYIRTRVGDFSLSGLRGFDLKGKTIGIIGTGHIGSIVARIAYGFEMNIYAYDIKPNAYLVKKYGVKYLPLNKLLSLSDIITLHAPYNKKTHHIINLTNIKKVKKACLIINTARGGLIDTQALIWALKHKRVGGAGLDVLEEQMVIKEEKELLSKKFLEKYDLATALRGHMLLAQDNVLITPHNAFNSTEAVHRILDTTIDNIHTYFKGRPTNVVRI